MRYLTFQGLEIPLVYVTALSYTKTAKTVQNSDGFARFRGYMPSEISLRLEVSRPRALAAGDNYYATLARFIDLQPEKSSEPSQVVLDTAILYPALKFRLTSINKSFQADINGNIDIAEFDLTLSGVECSKAESQRRVYDFSQTAISMPKITLKCLDKALEVGNDVCISGFTLTPFVSEIELCIGDDLSIIRDSAWLMALVENHAEVYIEGYGRFYVVSATLNENILHLTGSRWPKTAAQPVTRTFIDATLQDVLYALTGVKKGLIGEMPIEYYLTTSTPLDSLRALQNSAGFLIDAAPDEISFRSVPENIMPDIDFDLYVDDDLMTEPLRGIIWRDTVNEHKAGVTDDGAALNIDSAFTSNSPVFAAQCLRYARYMQNSIKVTAPIDARIKHHSAFYITKNNAAIPVMVEDYTLDFISGEMTLDLHYISRG